PPSRPVRCAVSSMLDRPSCRGRSGVTTWGTSGLARPAIASPAREPFSGLSIMDGRRSGGSGPWRRSLGGRASPPGGLQSLPSSFGPLALTLHRGLLVEGAAFHLLEHAVL